MREIGRYLLRMIPAAVLGLALYAVALPPRRRRLARLGLRSEPWRELALAGFLMFFVGLLWLTVLPAISWEQGRLVFREEGIGEINLRPFLIFKQSKALARQGITSYFLINFWGNIIMFLPIGFFPALLWRGGVWWKALLSGTALSLTIELCQIPISRGTDIDDLWLNTLGAMAGYWLYCLLKRFWPGGMEKCKVQEVDPWT